MTTIERILDYNTEKGDYGKLMEELAELSEVVVKSYIKVEGHKPPIEKVVEEIGDVLLRIDIIIRRLNIEEAVTERIENKLKKLTGYMDEGLYKGGV